MGPITAGGVTALFVFAALGGGAVLLGTARRRAIVTTGLACGVLLAGAGLAHATGTSYGSGFTNQDNRNLYNCAWVTTIIEDTASPVQHPRLQTQGEWPVTYNGQNCSVWGSTIAANRFAMQQNLEIWGYQQGCDADSFCWLPCNTNAPWIYNSGGSQTSVQTSFTWTSPPPGCGAGTYRSRANAFNYYIPEGWQQDNSVYSGYIGVA